MCAMTVWTQLGELVSTAHHPVVMYGVSWMSYETVLAIRGPRPRPRMAYLDGALEIMTTSDSHEHIKKFLACLLEAYMLHVDVTFAPVGSATMRNELSAAGIEP